MGQVAGLRENNVVYAVSEHVFRSASVGKNSTASRQSSQLQGP